MSKRAADGEAPLEPEDLLHFVNLGAGNEVGRSCHIIQFKGKTVMLDAGAHPAHSGLASLPFYDEFDLSTVDILLISQCVPSSLATLTSSFHVDHAASLPYVMTKTDFKGRVFMTHPTKAVLKWLLADYVRVSDPGADSEEQLYDERDLNACMERVETVDYHSTMEIEGIRFTPYHAGHVLGAAMFLVEIASVNILFTGDYSIEEDRHLHQAEVPKEKTHVMITESTYGTASHEPRLEKEARLINLITSTVQKGGRVLMPQFALGRAQEILLLLDEFWSLHPNLHHVPIYYASSLARKCMAIYQTYVNMMNDNIRNTYNERNPFVFRHISNLRSFDSFEDVGPSVVIASPGMLQSGVSRTLLERWCPDPKNSLLLTGYSVEGTMAKHITNGPTEIVSLSGHKIPRRMLVEEISFAAHVDFNQNRDFIDLVGPSFIILVHGEHNNMARLKSALLSKYSGRKGTSEVKVYNPRNCDPIDLPFKGEKIARTMGSLAATGPEEDRIISGVLVQKDFRLSLLATQDLAEFSDLITSEISQRQVLSFHAGSDLVKYHLEQMFGHVDMVAKDKDAAMTNGYSEAQDVFLIMDVVTVTVTKQNQLVVDWVGNAVNDSIADAVIAILIGIESSPASVKLTSQSCRMHAHVPLKERVERLGTFFDAQFGDSVRIAETEMEIKVGNHSCVIDYDTMAIKCEYEPLRSRVSHILARALQTIAPFAADRHVQSSELDAKEEVDTVTVKNEDE